jgi:hypothetical protein
MYRHILIVPQLTTYYCNYLLPILLTTVVLFDQLQFLSLLKLRCDHYDDYLQTLCELECSTEPAELLL